MVRIELLGDLRARAGERSVTRWRTQKTALLIGWLALFRERAHGREALIELLWPGCDPDAGRSSLSRELSWLRNQLGPVLIASRATVQLDPEATETDVAELRAALARARDSGGAKQKEELRRAVDLYRGELLPGHDGDAIQAERRRLTASFVAAARELARGGGGEARDLLLRAVACDPLSEEARRDLMLLHARAGEPAAALLVYEELARLLRVEIGAPPSPETEKLAREIEKAVRAPRPESRAAVRPSQRVALVPVGGTVTFLVHEAPAKVDAAVVRHGGRVIPGLGAVFARPSDALACAFTLDGVRALDTGEVAGEPDARAFAHAARLVAAARPGQLVVSEETAVLLRRDPDAGVRLADLGVYRLEGARGPSRVFQPLAPGKAGPDLPLAAPRVSQGKLPLELSRFFGRAPELARLQAEVRANRLVTVVGPGGVGKTRLALEALPLLAEDFRGAIHFVPLADVPGAAFLGAAIAQALELPGGKDPLDAVATALGDRPALLLLDNFEHLVAEGTPLVERLLARAKGLSCLVTSRQKLGLAGEREVLLSALDLDASVQLFLDRARAVKPDLELDVRSAPLVATLVERLEGLPLALVLAAGRTQLLGLEEILARFSERLDLLASRDRNVPERHRTLRAAIEGSVRLLTESQRRLHARLSVFRGAFLVEAAEAVSEDPQTLDLVADLCECSLLVPEGGRFRMLEMVREHALTLLEPAELARARRRHAEHYLALARQVSPSLKKEPAALDRIAREQGNLRAALEWSLEESPDVALGLAAALVPFWRIRGPFAEGRRFLDEALALEGGAAADRARALAGAGALAYALGDVASAAARFEESLPVSREAGDPVGVAGALNNLGVIARERGDLERARVLYEESAAVARGCDAKLAATAISNLGLMAQRRGDDRAARGLLEEAVALDRASGDLLGASGSLVYLSSVLANLGETDAARAAGKDALALARSFGSENGIARALLAVGWLELALGNAPEAARAHYAESLALFQKMGVSRGVAIAHANLASTALAAGDKAAARHHAEESLALCASDRPGAALAHRFLGEALEDPKKARAAYVEALTLGLADSEPAHAGACFQGLAGLASAEGEHERAARLLGAAAPLREARLGATLRDEKSVAELHERLVAALGAAAFESLLASGRALSKEAACALAGAPKGAPASS